jgi:hypothetical protein
MLLGFSIATVAGLMFWGLYELGMSLVKSATGQ